MLQLTFRLTFFQKYASRCCGKHIFAKRFLALPIKHITFLHLKRLQKGSFLPFLLALVALLAVQIAIFPLLELFKKGLWLECRARFASKAPSATTTACITPANLWISYAIECFLCIFTALHTLVFSKLHTFDKKWLPPSLGSTISKAAAMRNHKISAFSGPPVMWISTILPHLLHPGLLQKQ